MSAIDQVKAYWSRRPCNIRHSPEPIGTKKYFDDVLARKYLVESHIIAFAQFPRWCQKHVLELGCGIGTDTMSFAKAGASIVAVDISETSLQLCRTRANHYALSNRITFLNLDIENMMQHLPKHNYDLIYSFGVIHHTPRPWAALVQARMAASTNTILKIMLYHKWSTKALGISLRHGWDAVAKYSEAEQDCPVTFTYSKRQAKELLEGCGWEVTKMEVAHIFPYRVKDYVEYRYTKKLIWQWMPERMFRWMESKLGWHLLIEARPKAP